MAEVNFDRLMDMVRDNDCRVEAIHEKDCRACDLAPEVAGTVAAVLDPLEQWGKRTVANGVPGDTLLDQATRVVAHVLHRRLPGCQGGAA